MYLNHIKTVRTLNILVVFAIDTCLALLIYLLTFP